MSRLFRRYEFLLPRRFNDQQPVPDELLVETLLELERQFSAVSSETQVIHGQWRQNGLTYRDELVRVFVDVPDEPETRRYFEQFKETLKERFRQIDIWMTTYLVEVL